MISLDTNVLVRYVMQDDEQQSRVATALMESFDATTPGFVSLVTTLETAWVLARAYKLERHEIARWLDALLRSRELVVDRGEDVLRALRTYESGSSDFADCLITSISERTGCTSTVTFDVTARKTAGLTLLGA